MKNRSRTRKRPKFLNRLKFLIVFLLAWFCIHVAYVCYDGLHDYEGKADIAIVLGNTVYADSTLSPWLQGRVDKAYRLYMQGRVKQIMVSGGEGEFHVPEGMAMKRWLLAKNVPADRIIEDNDGKNTYLTAKDFLALDDSMHFSSAIAVTSFYHITRTKYIIRKLGFKNIYGASSDVFFGNDPYGLFRDFFAFYKYVIFY
jgi:vancomycin permeability regulator SanA